MNLGKLVSFLSFGMSAIACSTPSDIIAVRGVLDIARRTVATCKSGGVYDLLLADTAYHGIFLRVKELSPKGNQFVIAKFEGEVQTTPSMTRSEDRETLWVTRIVSVDAGKCE